MNLSFINIGFEINRCKMLFQIHYISQMFLLEHNLQNSNNLVLLDSFQTISINNCTSNPMILILTSYATLKKCRVLYLVVLISFKFVTFQQQKKKFGVHDKHKVNVIFAGLEGPDP